MTDTREQLNRAGPLPTPLPVALQVPSERVTSDSLVTPTSGEAVTQSPSQTTSSDADASTKPSEAVTVAASSAPPDFGGKPAGPGEDEVNPLPPAAEPDTAAAVANRMPPVPSVDPLSSTSTDRPATNPASDDAAASDNQAVKASSPPDDSTSPVPPPMPKQPTTQVVETSRVMCSTQTVFASPQSPPPKPSSQVKPTSQAKPSPQGAGPTTGFEWKRPCLRRLVRKVCHLGEFADSPTAAPH